MKKFLKRVLAPVIVGAMLVGVAGPAVAAEDAGPVTGVSDAAASSVGIGVKPGNLKVSASLDGGLGWLLGWAINPLLDTLLTPLTKAVNGLPAAAVNPLLETIVPGAKAGMPATGTRLVPTEFDLSGGEAPKPGEPVSCTEDSGTCYTPDLLGLVALPEDIDLGILRFQLGALTGTTEAVGVPSDWDIVAQAKTAGVELELLGIDLLDLGAVTSVAKCSAEGPTATSARAEVASLGLLNNAITVGVAQNTGALEVKVGDEIVVGAKSVDVNLPNLLGNVVELTVDERLLTVALGLDVSLSTLLGGLGLQGLGDVLETLTGVSVTLQAIVQVGTAVDYNENFARAAGLHVGVGLNLAVRASLLGLLGVRVSTNGSSADTVGNLLALNVAEASCGSTTTPTEADEWVDPGLT